MDLVTPEFGLIFWTSITFLVLLFILKKFAWKPILGAVSEREKGIKDALTSAVENKMIDDAKQDAKLEGNKLITQAQAAIEAEKKAAIADLKSQVAQISISIAEKVVREELSNTEKQEKLVESMLDNATLN